MFYFLSKVLAYVLTPAGIITTFIIAGLLVKNNRWKRRLLTGGLLCWFVLGSGLISNELSRWWEYPPTTLPAQTRPRVGVILTGGMMSTDIPPFTRILLGVTADRMGQAFLLYQSKQIQKIVISGGSDPIDGSQVANEAKLTASFLIKAGVNPADIVLENKSRNTEENARFSAPVLKERFADYEYVLITSASHMRRAVRCFEKKGISVTPFAADFTSRQRHYTPDNLLPAERPLWDNWALFHELFGYVIYKMMGYI